MIDKILLSVQENWGKLWPDTPYPQELRYVLQSRRRVIIFLFDVQRKGNKLVGVVKISRQAEENEQLERAVAHANQIRSQLHGGLLETVPKMILLPPIQGLSCCLEEGLPGDPMYIRGTARSTLGRHRQNWEAWANWLIEFQGQVASDEYIIDSPEIEQMMASHIKSQLVNKPELTCALDNLTSVAKDLVGMRFQKVWRYGDAHHSNILLHKGVVSGLVDWEGADDGHWPTTDWFQFAFQYLVDVQRAMHPKEDPNSLGMRAINALLQPRSAIDEMAQEKTLAFLSSWSIEPASMGTLFAVFLAQLHWPWGKDRLLGYASQVLC